MIVALLLMIPPSLFCTTAILLSWTSVSHFVAFIPRVVGLMSIVPWVCVLAKLMLIDEIPAEDLGGSCAFYAENSFWLINFRSILCGVSTCTGRDDTKYHIRRLSSCNDPHIKLIDRSFHFGNFV